MDSDGLLIALRGLSLAALIALLCGLIYLLTARRESLSPLARRTWLVIAVVKACLVLGGCFVETAWLVRAVAPESPIFAMGRRLYNSIFLLNAVMDATLPFGVLVLHGRAVLVRRASASMALVVAMVAVGWSMAGALRNWDILLTSTQVITFFGISGYLGFCGLWTLGRLPEADIYLAGFLAVSTLFNLLLPVQEVFFQLVGRESVKQIWHLNQFLQLAMHSSHVAIVLAFVNTLARGGRPAPRVPVAG